MSALARTALRLAVVNALQADATIAAICADRVFDSRIDDLDAKEPIPVIVIYTEDENGDELSHNNGGPPFRSTVDLVFEISMKATVPSDDDAPADISLPETDRELEIALDLLEQRAIEAVTIADTPQSALIRNFVTRRVRKVRSFRYVVPDTGVKLATRFITLTTELKDYQSDDPTVALSGPFAALPEPLRSVCVALPTDSSGYASGLAIAAKLTAPPVPTFMTGVDLTYAPQPLTANTTPTEADQVEVFKDKGDIDD